MKEICFTFDAFGQWSEHDSSKMKWRMKVGIEWRSSMAGREAMTTWAGRPATILGRPTTPWLPYKRVAKESLLLHPTSSKATSNFLNPSPSS
jgi:hypothetical protein